jgi:hypothetical protein
MQAADAERLSVRPDENPQPSVLDITQAPAAAPDLQHIAEVARLRHRAEGAEAQAAAAEEARLVAEEALQRLSECDARSPANTSSA